MKLRKSEISQLLNAEFRLLSDGLIESVIIDSRELVSTKANQTLFIAFKGTQQDGHEYISELEAEGVALFILEDEQFAPKHADYILVENTLTTLQVLAKHVREASKAKIIAIAGSNGKTMTKDALNHIIAESDLQVVASPRSYNSQIGVALSLLQINPDTEVAIIEAGISKSKEMEKLYHMIQPHYGIITHMGDAHARGFDSLESKIKEKMSLFRSAIKVLINAENPQVNFIETLVPQLEKVDEEDQIRAYLNEDDEGQVALNNLNLAFHMARILGISEEHIYSRITSWRPPENRLRLIEAQEESILIDDSYTNDLEALRGAILFTKSHAKGRRLVAVVTALEGEIEGEQVRQTLNQNGFDEIITIGKGFTQSQYEDVAGFLKQIKDHDLSHSAILVKGLHNYHLNQVVHFLQAQKNVTQLHILTDQLKQNYFDFKSTVSDRTKILLMLKAEAYGSGIHRWQKVIQDIQPNYIGVAHVDEGVRLRQVGIKLPILVLYSQPADINTIAAFELEPVIYNRSIWAALKQYRQNKVKFHIELDSGMHRLGFYEQELDSLFIEMKNSMHECVGIMSHLSSADEQEKDDFTLKQIQSFQQCAKKAELLFKKSLLKHIANSTATLRFPQAHFDMVRLGIGLFGINQPHKNVFIWKTKVAQVKEVAAGEGIGYGSLDASHLDRKIAILPVGYADGFDRGLGNGRWSVIVKNKQCPTVGNICMDMCMIDVTQMDCRTGDEVILMGEGNNAFNMSQTLDTIPYEIISRVAQRVNRVYVSE